MGPRLGAVLVATACAMTACSGGTGVSACAEVERIVEPSSIHVLGDTEVVYETSPPTSGPHRIPAPEPGVSTTPIPEPLQVAALEGGAVIVQYRPGLDAEAVTSLEALTVTDGVIVAPAIRDLDDDAVVAFTAWGVRRLCSAADVDEAEAFIDDHLGAFFVGHR